MKIQIKKDKKYIDIRRTDPGDPLLGYVSFYDANNLKYCLYNPNKGFLDEVPKPKFTKDILHPERRDQ